MPRPGLTAVQIVYVYAEFHAGSSIIQLSRRWGCSTTHIRELLIDCGATMRSRGYRMPAAVRQQSL